MEKIEKAHPEFEVEIGGEKLTVVCNYRTIYNYELAHGKPISSLLFDPTKVASVTVAVDFLTAAFKGKGKKYTREWILDNLEPSILTKVLNEVMPAAINAAFVTPEEVKQEKKDEKTSETSQE